MGLLLITKLIVNCFLHNDVHFLPKKAGKTIFVHEVYYVTIFTEAVIHVKVRKFFGVLFTILGAMTAFLSVAVLILPLVANDQTRLVLESFYQTSDNPLVNIINKVISFMIENGTLTLALGTGVLLTGILLLLSTVRLEEEQAGNRRSAQRKNPSSPQAAPVWQTRKTEKTPERNPFIAPMQEQPEQRKPTVSPAPDRTQEVNAPAAVQGEVPAPLPPSGNFAAADNFSCQRSPEPEVSMPPDDQVTSFGTARRISFAPAETETPAPAPVAQKEAGPAVTPLFSTGFHLPDKPAAEPAVQQAAPEPVRSAAPIAVPAAAPSPEPAPDPMPEPFPVSAPKKSKIVIKSTMGRHTV